MCFTEELVAAQLGQRPYRYYESVPSTMDVAHVWLIEDAPHGALVVTGQQTAGRGRMGRTWLDADGCALALSVILRPSTSAALPQVSMLGGLAALDAVGALGVPDPALKWPNDILIGDRKVCGVLVETAWDGPTLTGAILGIGLNVSGQFASAELSATATTMEEATGQKPDPAQVFGEIIRQLDARLPDLNTPSMFDAWRARLGTIGQRVRVEGSIAFEGIAEDVTETGALLVRADNGQLRTVLAGDVRLRPAHN